jgi:gliding motility-associated lipoprotein GldH
MLAKAISVFSFRMAPAALVLLSLLTACKPVGLYEKLYNLPGAQWKKDYTPEFNFIISDTTSEYNIWVVVRHTNNYPFRNIWLDLSLQMPGDSIRTQQFELALASADRWLGIGTGNVFERRVYLFSTPVKFSRSGEVRFRLRHNMRIDPLPHLLQVGIRVEPVANALP